MPERPRRRWWKLVLLAIVLLAVLVAAAPAILSAGPGAAFVRRVLARNVRGTGDVQSVKLRWFGEQRIKGLVISDGTDDTLVALDVRVDRGLLSLLTDRSSKVTIGATGAIRAVVREDGSTSIKPMFDTGAPKPPAPDQPTSLAGIPPISLAVKDVAVHLEGAGRALDLDALNGELVYTPGDAVTLALGSDTSSEGVRGRLDVNVRAENLVDGGGTITAKGARLHASLAARSLPVPGVEQLRLIEQATINADADDLTDVITVGITGDALLEGDARSTLVANLSLREIISADGAVGFAPERVTGTVSGRDVPTALLQPLLTDTPVVAVRDIGPVVTVEASFSEGAEKQVTVNLASGDQTDVQLAANVGADGAIRDGSLTARLLLQPPLAATISAVHTGAPVPVTLMLQDLTIPGRGADGALPLADLAVRATLTVGEGLRCGRTAEQALDVHEARLNLAAERLGEGANLSGELVLGATRVTIEERLTGLLDEAGAIDAINAVPVGTLTVTGIDGALADAVAPPDLAALARPLLEKPATLSIATKQTPGGLRANAALDGTDLTAAAVVVRGADDLRIEASASLRATPSLVAALTEEEPAATLAAPATLLLTVRPTPIPGRTFADYDFGAATIEAELSSEEIRLAHPRFVEPLVVDALKATVRTSPGTAEDDGMQYDVDGGATLKRGGGGPLAVLAMDLDGRAGAALPTGSVELTRIDVDGLEGLLGLAAGRLAGWVGDRGDVTLGLDGSTAMRATLDVALPRLSGTATVAVEDEVFTATTQQMRMTVAAPTLERALNPPDEDGTPAADPLRVLEDLTCTLELAACRAPTALFGGGSFDPAVVDLDASLRGGPLVLANAEGAATRLDDVAFTVRSDDLSEGIAFTLDGQVPAGARGTGTIDAQGTVDNLMSETSTLDTAAATVNMTANMTSMPTAIADAFLGLKGLLVAALGPEMNATAKSRNFSRFTGDLDARFTTTNGFLEGLLRGRKDALRTQMSKPLRGELSITPPLRERLLAKIHPILADVETTEQPLRVLFTESAVLPLDGDLSRLRADIEITVGKVKFKSGDTMLALLSLFHEAKGERMGEIEPIVARIRKGVVTYDRFAVRIDKYTLLYEGRVDLVNRTVDLRTTIPLEGLAGSFKELEGYADKIVVPLVTRGPIDDPKTEIDPDFDLAGAALRAGAGGALDGVLKGTPGEGLGGLLGELLKGDKDKKKDDDN